MANITSENLHYLGKYDRYNKAKNGIRKRIKFL